MAKDQVRVHVPYAGGSFGLHSTSGHDPASEAVQVARALDWKYPVKVQSLRQEELKAGRYRAMAVHRVRAGADAQGRLTAFHQQIAAEPTSTNLPFAVDFLFKDGVDYMTTSGAVDGPYALANFKLETTNVQTGVPIMVWRSVGNSHTEFARESAIDELALAVGRDPVDLRRDLLGGNPRTLRALELAAERGGWGTPPPKGHARGIACSSFLDSHSAGLHGPCGAMRIFMVFASRSRSKAAGALSMLAISEVRSATWSAPSASRAITSANSSA